MVCKMVRCRSRFAGLDFTLDLHLRCRILDLPKLRLLTFIPDEPTDIEWIEERQKEGPFVNPTRALQLRLAVLGEVDEVAAREVGCWREDVPDGDKICEIVLIYATMGGKCKTYKMYVNITIGIPSKHQKYASTLLMGSFHAVWHAPTMR